jgi:hypothetical protein
VTQINGMFGAPVTMQIYRDGSKAVIDHIQQNGTHTRSLYDLQAHTNYSWDMANPRATRRPELPITLLKIARDTVIVEEPHASRFQFLRKRGSQ